MLWAAWAEVVAAAIERGDRVSEEAIATAVARLGPDVRATPSAIRLRLAPSRPRTEAPEQLTRQGRALEALEVALLLAERAVAEAVAAAVPAPGDETTSPAEPGGAPASDHGARITATSPSLEGARAAIKSAERLFYSATWNHAGRAMPAELALRFAFLESDLAEAGLISADSATFSRSTYQPLPGDSLLRAEAAWRYARLGRETSRYLRGDEDLELAIPLWRATGELERAATAAWWIAQDELTSRARAEQHAQLALELYRGLGEAARVAEIEAWQLARGR